MKTKTVAEFGDFQTPDELALQAAGVISCLRPKAIIEPTCGRGAFLRAAAKTFPEATLVGVEINPSYLAKVGVSAKLVEGDFFTTDWQELLSDLPDPILILGNPPWVTNAELGSLLSKNVPQKSNFNGHRGIEAVTGKANFDISEWMLLRYLDWLSGREGTIAVLCKTAVARKILLNAWKRDYPIKSARIYRIDAMRHFDAAVDACFFLLQVGSKNAKECTVYSDLSERTQERSLGFRAGKLVTDLDYYERHSHLMAPEMGYLWRSGVKHDCSKVMELSLTEGSLKNGLGELIRIENEYIYPLLKSSDIANGRTDIRRAIIMTQRPVGEDTKGIMHSAPLTWAYLTEHAEFLDKRGSIIYRKNPRFCLFGVGDYSFAPWKVAISGFYKRFVFTKVGPHGKPVMFDDTINFLPCQTEEEATFILDVLSSERAREFLTSMVSWSDKRPITAELLRRLSIRNLAADLGRLQEYEAYTQRAQRDLFVNTAA